MGDLGGRWAGILFCWGGTTLGGDTSSKLSLQGVGSGIGVVGGGGCCCWMGVAPPLEVVGAPPLEVVFPVVLGALFLGFLAPATPQRDHEVVRWAQVG